MSDGQAAVLPDLGVGYRRHRPEETLLYRIVERYYATFADLMTAQGRPLPAFAHRKFDDYPQCGRLDHGFFTQRLPAGSGPAPGRCQDLTKTGQESVLLAPGTGTGVLSGCRLYFLAGYINLGCSHSG